MARDNEMKGKERNRRIMSEFDRARQRIAAKNVSLDILNAAKAMNVSFSRGKRLISILEKLRGGVSRSNVR